MINLFFNSIKEKLGDYKPFIDLKTRIEQEKFPIELEGVDGLFKAVLSAVLYEDSGRTITIITADEKECDAVRKDLEVLGHKVLLFSGFNKRAYSRGKIQSSILGERMKIMSEMLSGENKIVVTTLRTFLSPLPPPEYIRKQIFKIKISDDLDTNEIEKLMTEFGYLRVPRVSIHGEFALRGEVLDIFVSGMDEPVRIVFEFDEVEEIRTFDPLTQKSIEKIKEVEILPVKEFVWNDERILGIKTRLSGREFGNVDEIEPLIEELTENREIDYEEILFPLSFDYQAKLSDYNGSEGITIFSGFENLSRLFGQIKKEYNKLYAETRITVDNPEGCFYPHPSEILLDLDEVIENTPDRVMLANIKDPEKKDLRIDFKYNGPRAFFGNISYFREELKSLLQAGYRIDIFAESHTQSERIKYLLKDADVNIYDSGITSGFSLPELNIIAIAESEIFGRRKKLPSSIKKAKSEAIETFVDLNPGDFVVHVNYGIGLFKGIDRIRTKKTERDYIKLEYSDEEMVFLPIEQVNLIQRYIGNEGRPPALDRIGGKAWEKRKNKVKKSVEDLADMLIKLYSERKEAVGYAFPKDTDWQIEFEAAFPYQETDDQLTCIDEIKSDMENPTPMDRLVCGDVGYGKTEVAMRAAMKAVIGGRQVAFLAPTTILAEQHYENFVERFERFPVKIDMISRFVPRKKQREVLEKTAAGNIDILIGTHRILQKDVNYKQLGLLIIDEEQRFGVKDKERLKQLKTNIDSLALSATPIPRTLHMSLLKIRDMSLLKTAPHNRRPIETYIREFDDEVIAEAIRRETDRGGQVFYLHNRVETLEQVQMFLSRVVPEVMVETAHGQMSSSQLEDVMHRFIHGGFQVLIATTIIENGIDIPNVNTIIIDRADNYGISQLYQLRGRVGRSNRASYAYLLYPDQRALSEIAMKRLQVISDLTELGSGFKIAMKDMEIRGAGNLLGRQQSGDIMSVGFDMYVKLLDEAVSERSTEKTEPRAPEVFLDLDYSGFIPDNYISESVEKMEVYKKIASVQNDEELAGINQELEDRFGPLPEEVQNLIAIADIRAMSKKLHVSRIMERGGSIRVEFAFIRAINPDKVARLIVESGGKVTINQKKINELIIKTETISLAEKAEFLRERLNMLV
ncbi:MAG: transcription-repair coupling factor [Spirochaetales bacterium]|uniref:Transcription-repair-coupling factor n=1 Tax=Candidatus Thalassospirochaeta sargassi TaxID=3119039 RepID=A0AAJ1ID63_9SPIO|nr:transcription-repair coupling factor [Spirochaetales bacterium]